MIKEMNIYYFESHVHLRKVCGVKLEVN